LINQANYLLDRQIVGLENQFVTKGGYSENLAEARRLERQRNPSERPDQTDRTDQKTPVCPLCQKPMALRTARQGRNAGARFWGCSAYPECKGTRKME
jgi:restriction system protein